MGRGDCVGGTTNVIRHGTYPGDPEHSQTLANLKTRITTAATSDAFANNRIANVSGLQAYYTTIGAYEDITPDDGQTTTFTPAQPLPMRPCANGTAVPNPRDNRMLVRDCEVLLALKDTLAGTATLNWSTSTAITSWDGVTTAGTPSRVTQLVLTSMNLTGTIPLGLAQLTGLTELKLDNNRLTGCIPLPLRQISDHDLDDLSLSYCGNPPPTPGGLSASLASGTYTITWDVVTGADLYEVQLRAGSDVNWVALPTTASTSTTYSPPGGALCGAIEFRVRARGDGITYIPRGEPSSGSEVASTVTIELNADCELLLSIKDTLAGTGTLNWSREIGIASWEGVSISVGTTSRVWIIQILFDDLSGSIPAEIGDLDALVQLYLSFNSLTGSIPKELGNLTNLTTLSLIDNQLTGSIPAELTALNLTTLELSGNSFTGCIPLALQNVPRNDLGDLGLAYCAYPPAPQGLTTLLTESSFIVSWDVLAGASKYEVQYRVAGSGASWTVLPETTSTTVTFTPSGSAVCDSSYEFQVRAYGDGNGYEAGWGPAIETTDACNQPPVIADQTFSVFEDAQIGDDVGTITASDPDNDTLSYAITTGDEGKFAMGPADGMITVVAALDYEKRQSYSLIVEVSDGINAISTATVTIAVTNVADTVPSAPQSFSASLSDPTFSFMWDALSGAAKYQVRFHTGDDVWANAGLEATTNTASFSPPTGPACGTTYSFQVLAFGDGSAFFADWGTASDVVEVTTAACNLPPVFVDQSFSVSEDAQIGDDVGTITASDPDNDTLSYAITAGDEGKFAMGPADGMITVAAALDYEDKQSYSLTVEVCDGRGGSAIATVTITISDVLDTLAPAPQNFAVALSGTDFSFIWDPVPGTSEFRVQFHTGDDQWTEAVTGISGTSTTLTPDCGTTYTFRVQAYGDGTTYLQQWGADSDTQTGTTETCNLPPAFAQTDYDFAVSELAEVNSVVGIVSATDPDNGDTLSYSIADGNTNTSFSIMSNNDGDGAIAVAAALNYDMTPSYTLTVAASDGRGGTATTAVRISLEQATCSSGKAVPDPEVNPGLVGDCEVLLAAKETLEGNAELNWSAKRNITNWTGVRLSEVDPIRVVQLRLGNMGLSGSIPSGLSSLSKVTLLNLKENQMVGTIPTEIGTMSELEYLRLSDNQFSGEIPAELGNLSNLKVLLLRGNQLIGQIPSRLGNLADTLRTLLIADNDDLTGCIPRPLQDVSDNDFGDSHLSICTPPPTPTP